MNEMPKEMMEQLNILKNKYIASLSQKFDEIQSAFCECKNDLTIENLNSLCALVHKISGTSGMYGLSNLRDKATEIEGFIRKLKEKSDIILVENQQILLTLDGDLKVIGNIINETIVGTEVKK